MLIMIKNNFLYIGETTEKGKSETEAATGYPGRRGHPESGS